MSLSKCVTRQLFSLILAALFAVGLATSRSIAQCESVWQTFPLSAGPFSGGASCAIVWDSDGSGPQPSKVVVGYKVYDPTTGLWSTLGSDWNGSPAALAVLPNGDLIAAGSFTRAGGVWVDRIARWNGSTWVALGSGIGSSSNDSVAALAVLPNGDLVAAGSFSTAGGVSVQNIARWNGSTWSRLATLDLNGPVQCLAVLPNGNLVAGGRFTRANFTNTVVNYIARWDGSTWSPLGSGLSGGSYIDARALTVLPNGDLVVGGNFTGAGGANSSNIASWNGSSWSSMGTGVNATVISLSSLSNGDVVAGGSFSTASGVPVNRIARWNGSSWFAIGSGFNDDVLATTVLSNGDLVATGDFSASGPTLTGGTARWNGIGWTSLAGGMDNGVLSLISLSDGGLIAAGQFSKAEQTDASRIARWDGSAWSSLGSGIDGPVHALAVLSSGHVIAGGSFANAGGVSASNIALWDGSAWSPLGSGIGGTPPRTVRALAVLPNGDIVAGGTFSTAGGVAVSSIARWNGAAWAPLGSGLNDGFGVGTANALAVLPSGDLIAGGLFFFAGGVANNIARWNGVAWSPMGSGMNGRVYALAVLPNGELLAGGDFTMAGGVNASRIARWNGTAWAALGSGVDGSVLALSVLPNGDVIAGGSFNNAGGNSAANLARWNGSTWSPLGSGTNSLVRAMTVLPDGDIALGGDFTIAGGLNAQRIARWGNPPPLTITRQPASGTFPNDAIFGLLATPASGFANVSWQWQRNGINVVNGPGGASPGGGSILDASGSIGPLTTGAFVRIVIINARPSDSGIYTVTFTNSCDTVTSLPATITVTPPPCAADFNADTVLDFFDYLDFVSAFAANQPAADFNADTVIDFFDYLDFVAEFANGC